MYETLRRNFYWLLRAADIDHIVHSCTSCVRNDPKYYQRYSTHFFPASRPLEFITIDLVRRFSKNCARHPVDPCHYGPLLQANTGSPGIENASDKHPKCVHGLLAYAIRHTNVSIDRQQNSIRKQALRNSVHTTRS